MAMRKKNFLCKQNTQCNLVRMKYTPCFGPKWSRAPGYPTSDQNLSKTFPLVAVHTYIAHMKGSPSWGGGETERR